MTVRLSRRQAICRTAFVIAGSVVSLGRANVVLAEGWPAKLITAIVPFGAGSGADVIARVVLDKLASRLGRPIIIENRGGAGGMLGANVVAQATPDGGVILVTGALASADALYPIKPYDTLRDFAPVISLGQQPLVLVTAPSKGFRTLSDLIGAAKARPGALNFASAGVGSASHFAAERLLISAGVQAQHIPFRGASEAMSEVLAGRMDFFFVPLAPALPFVNEGKLVALAVSTSQRASAMPLVPSTAEAGLADSTYNFSVGLFLPAKTPRDIILRLHRETEMVLQEPSVQERLATLGVEPMPMSPEEFKEYFRADVEMNAKIVRLANIRLQQ